MVVEIQYLNRRGDEKLALDEAEARRLTEAKEGQYYVVDTETKKLVSSVQIKDGQSLMFVPIIRGG